MLCKNHEENDWSVSITLIINDDRENKDIGVIIYIYTDTCKDIPASENLPASSLPSSPESALPLFESTELLKLQPEMTTFIFFPGTYILEV